MKYKFSIIEPDQGIRYHNQPKKELKNIARFADNSTVVLVLGSDWQNREDALFALKELARYIKRVFPKKGTEG